MLFEEVFGLQSDIPNNRLVLDISLLDEYGVENYPFADKGVLDISASPRNNTKEKPKINIQSAIGLTLEIRWDGESLTDKIEPGKQLKF